ncbi:hypothetical protein JHU04_003583 [Brenneria sp. 4F2]|nr:hypothetical protein [Brenneria bubanii]
MIEAWRRVVNNSHYSQCENRMAAMMKPFYAQVAAAVDVIAGAFAFTISNQALWITTAHCCVNAGGGGH